MPICLVANAPIAFRHTTRFKQACASGSCYQMRVHEFRALFELWSEFRSTSAGWQLDDADARDQFDRALKELTGTFDREIRRAALSAVQAWYPCHSRMSKAIWARS